MANYNNQRQVLVVRGVNLNAIGSAAVPVNFGNYIVRRVTVLNASTTLAATSATLGVYTATAGGGTAVVTAATGSLTPLTGATIIKDCTIAAAAVTVNSGQLFVFVGVAHGAPATCDVLIDVQHA